MKKISVTVYRIAEAFTLEMDALNHTDAIQTSLRRVKQRLIKPNEIGYDLLAISLDGAHVGIGTENSEQRQWRR